jgi:hypothetical protein
LDFLLSFDQCRFHLSFALCELAIQSFPALPAITRWHSAEHAKTDLNSNWLLYRSTFLPQLQHGSSTFSFVLPLCPQSLEQTTCLLSFVPIGFPHVLQGLFRRSFKSCFFFAKTRSQHPLHLPFAPCGN